MTPLFKAVQRRNVDIVKILLLDGKINTKLSNLLPRSPIL